MAAAALVLLGAHPSPQEGWMHHTREYYNPLGPSSKWWLIRPANIGASKIGIGISHSSLSC